MGLKWKELTSARGLEGVFGRYGIKGMRNRGWALRGWEFGFVRAAGVICVCVYIVRLQFMEWGVLEIVVRLPTSREFLRLFVFSFARLSLSCLEFLT